MQDTIMKKQTKNSKSIKLETALLFIFISLIIGFLGGVVFSAFKMGPDVPLAKTMPPHAEHAETDMHPESEGKIAELRKTVTESPDNASAWVALGNAYFDTQQVKQAIEAYENALKHQPDNANVLTDLGVMYRRDNQPQKAAETFDRAQAADPTHEVSLFNKGVVLMHDLNDISGALAAWEKLLARNPAARAPSGQLVLELVDRIKQPGN